MRWLRSHRPRLIHDAVAVSARADDVVEDCGVVVASEAGIEVDGRGPIRAAWLPQLAAPAVELKARLP
jgi:hypothetical protein